MADIHPQRLKPVEAVAILRFGQVFYVIDTTGMPRSNLTKEQTEARALACFRFNGPARVKHGDSRVAYNAARRACEAILNRSLPRSRV